MEEKTSNLISLILNCVALLFFVIGMIMAGVAVIDARVDLGDIAPKINDDTFLLSSGIVFVGFAGIMVVIDKILSYFLSKRKAPKLGD